MSIDTVRDEAIRKALYAFWESSDEEALPFALSIDKPVKYKNVAMGFHAGYRAALSTIDPGAIRAEVVEEYGDLIRAARAIIKATDRVAFAWKVGKCGPLSPNSCYIPDIANALDRLRAAILGAEPARDDGKPEVGDIVAYAFADGTTTLDRWNGQREYNARIIVLMRAAEVKRRIEGGE